MKRILITGKNSYIGTSFENYISKYPNDYSVDTLDMRDDYWKAYDFTKYDVVFHVAGIAHIKETKRNRDLYFKVNRDLAIETAKLSKESGVNHFIFLSTMSVFGLDEGVIDENTPTLPKNAYGQSKLDAEKEIIKLSDDKFIVVIVRPPMVYGKGCKGNYQKLSKFSKITPIFPNIKNRRSMIYIDNLSEFIKRTIDIKLQGYYQPENLEHVSIADLVKELSKLNNKHMIMTKLFNRIITSSKNSIIKKMFGNLYYSSHISTKIETVSFKTSILISENDNL